MQDKHNDLSSDPEKNTGSDLDDIKIELLHIKNGLIEVLENQRYIFRYFEDVEDKLEVIQNRETNKIIPIVEPAGLNDDNRYLFVAVGAAIILIVIAVLIISFIFYK